MISKDNYQMCRKLIKQIFYISQCGSSDPLLESHIKEMNIKSLPQGFQKDLQLLKQSAAQNQVVSLSANQIRMEHRMFAILKSSKIKPGKWINYDQVTPNDYRIVINPVIVGQSSLRLKDFQECPSIPGLRFHIWNPISQTYQYFSPTIIGNEVKLEQITQKLKGFQSRVFDHEIRHLQGFLALDPKISHNELSVGQDFQDNPNIHLMAQYLKAQLKFTSEENMAKMIKKGNQNKSEQFLNPENIPQKISKEMKGKMDKHYKKMKELLKQQSSK